MLRAKAAVAAAAAAALSLLVLSVVLTSAPHAGLLQGATWTTQLSYASGPISPGPAAAHIDYGEPDVAAYLKDRAERGRDASIAMRSPSSAHTPGYHGGVNRWREGRATPLGLVFPTYSSTSEQDARPVAWGYDQGTGYLGGPGWGPNYSGEGQEGAPRELGATETKYFERAAESYDSALDHLYGAQVSAAGADWVASHGFYPEMAPRVPEYADDAYTDVDRVASNFPPGLSNPEWYPGHESMESYYANYWDGVPDAYFYPEPDRLPVRGFKPSGLDKPVVFNGETYFY